MKSAGLNLDVLREQEARDLAESQKWVQEVIPTLAMADGEAEVTKRLAVDEAMESRNLALTPVGYTVLTPIGATEISSHSLSQVWLPGYCQNYYVKAWGGGWGCTGGVGSILRHVTWWFSFTPSGNKFYSIIPFVKFRGFYLTKANDKWYNCKHARGRVQIKVNAYQYNWKGEEVRTVLDSSGGNISVNHRFDTTRHVYYTALLGGGDKVWIRVRVALYAYAKGGGSYSELNFATGAANYLCVNNVWVG